MQPLPLWLKTFLPAYKSTRIIAEVTLESLPQCLLQAYILVVIQQRVAAGTASAEDLAVRPFASLLPKSIAISTLAMLKTWIELVLFSRQAGMSVRARFVQLWHVGAGLPLDTLHKGGVQEWICPRRIEPSEVRPLLDALASNHSLKSLSLARSGLRWDGPGDNGSPLIEAIALKPAALASLQALVIDARTAFPIPLKQLRQGGDTALSALEGMHFFAPDGPCRAEILFIADVIRTNRRAEVITEGEAAEGEKAVALVEASVSAARSADNKGLRDIWESGVKAMMASGNLRRSQLQSLINLDVLRGVGFTVRELVPLAGPSTLTHRPPALYLLQPRLHPETFVPFHYHRRQRASLSRHCALRGTLPRRRCCSNRIRLLR